jgi:hypothetical protein
MTTTQESNIIECYFKIPFTSITTTITLNKNITMSEFMERIVNVEIRNKLSIHSKYDIEIIEAGNPKCELANCIVPIMNETLLQRYGDTKNSISYYARPVNQVTREFTRDIDYTV